jgi:hypothetical protein
MDPFVVAGDVSRIEGRSQAAARKRFREIDQIGGR